MDVKTAKHFFQFAIGAVGGWVSWFVGGFDGLVYALVIFAALDYLTGVMLAVVEKKLSSNIGMKGIFKKMLMIILIGVGQTIDTQLIGDSNVVRSAVCLFFISMEGVSIIENAASLGLPVPQKLRDMLSQLNKSGGD